VEDGRSPNRGLTTGNSEYRNDIENRRREESKGTSGSGKRRMNVTIVTLRIAYLLKPVPVDQRLNRIPINKQRKMNEDTEKRGIRVQERAGREE
jgi:hypothetical protein